MLNNITLRTRIYTVLSMLVLITFSGGLVMLWYTYKIEALFKVIIDKNMAAYQVVETLETALVNQKGFVTYFFLDNDPAWLEQLGVYRQIFKERLKEAKDLAELREQEEIINEIERKYNRYITLKDKVIEYYKNGDRETGLKFHGKVRDYFFQTLDLCEKYKKLYIDEMREVKKSSLNQAMGLRIFTGSAILVVLILGSVLAVILIRNILEPLRRLTLETSRKNPVADSSNELTALSMGVQNLIEDIDHTHTELERSRETLLQSEKMALVGRLAAGVAHSIRNPLTSAKMRLFSLSRSLNMSPVQEEDFQVISKEIGHIDTIIQNFLEFSRPPKLTMQEVSPSAVIDLVLQLTKHKLESYNVKLNLDRNHALPLIQADPEQMKEVLVNLIDNACESMKGGGEITISEREEISEELGPVISIRVTDNGPGIPESIRDQVLQHFFTTKEEGTGLGLSIARRIVENHGGILDFTSEEKKGTTFIISIPVKDKKDEQVTDY